MRNKTLPKMWGQNHKNNVFKLFAIYAELGEIITININTRVCVCVCLL